MSFSTESAESGISEEGGKKLAESTFGPLGGLAFSAAKISFIDVPEMVGKSYLNDVQLQQACS